MKNKICKDFYEAVSDVPNGASIMISLCTGPAGIAQNLILALRDHGAKNLTIIANGLGPMTGTHSLRDFKPYIGPRVLVESGQVRKVIVAYLAGFAEFSESKVEIELHPTGTLTEKIRAGGVGLGGFYSPVGADTVAVEGKEHRIINGKEYVLETPLRADYAFIRGYKADKMGNLVYRGVMRNTNPIMAMAADICIAEVDDIVETGELDPEHIVTPGCFIDRIVKRRSEDERPFDR